MQWWRITKRNTDLERELQSDLALEEEEQRERGLSSEEARYAALRAFGNPTLIREQTHATWSWSWLESLASDGKYGIRGMRRNAGSTVLAILIVGLGIGGASTVFSVVNALLLRPLPFRHPGQLVWISNAENYNTQAEHYSDLRDQNQSFSDLAGWAGTYSAGDKELTGTGEPERLTSVPVTANFFPLLGVDPALGRSFTTEESQGKYSAPPAVLLSDSFWRRRFHSDPNVVGQKLTLNNQPATVVGILPASFDFASIFAPGTPIDIFIPWPLTDNTKPAGNTMNIVGRLKPGATVDGAQAEFTLLAKQLVSQHPDRNPIFPRLVPLEQHVSGQVRPALVVLMCAVGVVMLIVCANLAHLQMARMGTRQKEMAIRAALGAGRFRLLRQVLTESVILSCCGAALGLLLAVAGTRGLAHLNAFNLPLLASVRVDGSTLAFTLLAAVASGVLFGLAPALQVPAYKLREGTARCGPRIEWRQPAWLVPRRTGGLTVRPRLRAAGGRGAAHAKFSARPGRESGISTGARSRVEDRPGFSDARVWRNRTHLSTMSLHRARSVPGITAAGISDVLPLDGDRGWQVSGKGQVYDKDHHPEAFIRVVSDGYFEALGIRVEVGERIHGERSSIE